MLFEVSVFELGDSIHIWCQEESWSVNQNLSAAKIQVEWWILVQGWTHLVANLRRRRAGVWCTMVLRRVRERVVCAKGRVATPAPAPVPQIPVHLLVIAILLLSSL